MYSIMHYIPLIGPFVLAQKKLEVEGHNFKSNGIYSFPCFADNEQHIEFNDSSKKAKEQKELVEKREQENKNMFDYNYNSNYLNNTANKHAITNLKEGLKAAGKSIAGSNAVTGGTQDRKSVV